MSRLRRGRSGWQTDKVGRSINRSAWSAVAQEQATAHRARIPERTLGRSRHAKRRRQHVGVTAQAVAAGAWSRGVVACVRSLQRRWPLVIPAADRPPWLKAGGMGGRGGNWSGLRCIRIQGSVTFQVHCTRAYGPRVAHQHCVTDFTERGTLGKCGPVRWGPCVYGARTGPRSAVGRGPPQAATG